MRVEIPDIAVEYGFAVGTACPHAARTMMLRELRELLSQDDSATTLQAFRESIITANALLKPTVTARRKAFRFLRELYALDHQVTLFRSLRMLWDVNQQEQPLLALLTALARDPTLRGTADAVLTAGVGDSVTPQKLSGCLERVFPGRYRPEILAKVGRNAASSWRQSGHLKGKLRKVRERVRPGPTSIAYGLLLGYLCDVRADALLRTLWVRILDTPEHEVRELAVAASRQGWLEYRYAGGVTEMTFRHLLGEEGRAV